jgi:hypothetical protein
VFQQEEEPGLVERLKGKRRQERGETLNFSLFNTIN